MRRAASLLLTTAGLTLALAASPAAPAPLVPAGWKQQAQGPATLLQPARLEAGEVYTIMVFPPQPLEGKSVQAWTEGVVQAGLPQYGKLITRGKVEANSGLWLSANLVEYRGQRLIVSFFAFPHASGQVRLVTVLATPSEVARRKYSQDAADVLGALLAEARTTEVTATRLPPGARPGGTLEPGAYACTMSLNDDSFRRFTLGLYANGEWRRDQDGREFDTGTFTYDPGSGRLDVSFEFRMMNSGSQSSTYYRDTAGKPVIHAETDVGTAMSLTQCTYAGKTTKPSPSAAKAKQEAEEAEARRFKWVTKPGHGVQAARIDAVLHQGTGTYTASGYRYEESVLLLLRDGWMYKNLRVPPADLDVAASRKNEPGEWMRWKRQGEQVLAQDRKTLRWAPVKGRKVVPARAGERLNTTVEHSHGYSIGFGAYGGYSWTNTIKLRKDGTFERATSMIGGTGVAQATNGFVAGVTAQRDKTGCSASSSFSGPGVAGGTTKQQPRDCTGDHSGTYKLNAYEIEFRGANGKVARELFFFWDAKKDAVFIKNATYFTPK